MSLTGEIQPNAGQLSLGLLENVAKSHGGDAYDPRFFDLAREGVRLQPEREGRLRCQRMVGRFME